MVKKIGSKLLLTYFLILIIAFSATAVLYNFLSRNYLIRETQKHLREEATAVAEMINNLPVLEAKNTNERLNEKFLERMRIVRAAGKFVDAEMIIVNREGRIVYKDIKEKEKEKNLLDLLDRLDKARANGYVVERVPIIGKTNLVNGYVILYAQVENIYELNRLMRRTQLLSFAIAGILALTIGIAFEKSITKPITQLALKMRGYTARKTFDLPDIKTGDEIEQLDKAFKKMISRIKKYDEAQIKFLQNTSHELKTPLMSIQGYAEAIKDGVVEGQEAVDSLDIIIEQSQRLKKIVEEIVYLTKLENADEVFKAAEASLLSCIRNAIKSLKPIADERSIRIELKMDDDITGIYDEEKLTRAFVNLLGNAVRYAKNSIIIKVEDITDKVVVDVEDDGVGFEKNEEKRVFERFYKGHKGNTGLGLSITKAIIEGHKGSIEALNNSYGGATFRIKLPHNNK